MFLPCLLQSSLAFQLSSDKRPSSFVRLTSSRGFRFAVPLLRSSKLLKSFELYLRRGLGLYLLHCPWIRTILSFSDWFFLFLCHWDCFRGWPFSLFFLANRVLEWSTCLCWVCICEDHLVTKWYHVSLQIHTIFHRNSSYYVRFWRLATLRHHSFSWIWSLWD